MITKKIFPQPLFACPSLLTGEHQTDVQMRYKAYYLSNEFTFTSKLIVTYDLCLEQYGFNQELETAGRGEKKGKTQERMERGSRKRSLSA